MLMPSHLLLGQELCCRILLHRLSILEAAHVAALDSRLSAMDPQQVSSDAVCSCYWLPDLLLPGSQCSAWPVVTAGCSHTIYVPWSRHGVVFKWSGHKCFQSISFDSTETIDIRYNSFRIYRIDFSQTFIIICHTYNYHIVGYHHF